MPAMLISVEAAHVDNTSLLDYLPSKVALEELVIGSTDPNISLYHNCMDDKLHFVMPGGSGNSEVQDDQTNKGNAIPTARWR
jgi:hypothetical protein